MKRQLGRGATIGISLAAYFGYDAMVRKLIYTTMPERDFTGRYVK
ncbi:MAG: hypothetical protein V4543_09645 [Bacteroidota bacterium]